MVKTKMIFCEVFIIYWKFVISSPSVYRWLVRCRLFGNSILLLIFLIWFVIVDANLCNSARTVSSDWKCWQMCHRTVHISKRFLALALWLRSGKINFRTNLLCLFRNYRNCLVCRLHVFLFGTNSFENVRFFAIF